MQQIHIHGAANVLLADTGAQEWHAADILVTGARIDRAAPSLDQQHDRYDSAVNFDAGGLLVLPGIVDVHGDAFERQVQPRPETVFSYDIAMAETDRQLIANGITTACHGLTFSWEGGLRGRDAAMAMLRTVMGQRSRFQSDHRIHLRFENHHVDGLRDALDWISQGWISVVAFNDHLPSIARKAEKPEKLAAYSERARCSGEVFRDRLQSAQLRTNEVPRVVNAIAAECRRRGVPMASHDDETRGDRMRYQEMEVRISEFPRTREALSTAIELGNEVVMGAPNVLLGGSHCGGLSTTEAVRDGACNILASDYYYPSLLHAPFRLAFVEQACSLAQAWRMVSQNPADALGLRDRGRITAGCRADLVLVEATPYGDVRLVATIAAGRIVYCADHARLSVNRTYPLAA